MSCTQTLAWCVCPPWKRLLPSLPRDAAVKLLQPTARPAARTLAAPHQINTATVNAGLWAAGACVCVWMLLIKEKKSAFFQSSRKQMSSVKKCNSSLISSECCKSASVMEEDGGGYFCVIPVYLWHMKTWHNKCTSFMVHPHSFLSLSDFMRGFILVCLLRTQLLQACFVSAVFFRRWPREDSLGTSGGGDAEDDTHLLREKPPAAHQETRSQPGRLERKISGGRWHRRASETIKVVKIILKRGSYLQTQTHIKPLPGESTSVSFGC